MKRITSNENRLVALGVLTILTTFCIALMPLENYSKSTKVDVTESSNYLFLAGGSPEELSINFDVNSSSGSKSELFSTTSQPNNALKCFQNNTLISCLLNGKSASIDLRDDLNSKEVLVVYSKSTKSIALESGKVKSVVSVDPVLEVTNLKFNLSEIQNAKFEVITGSSKSMWSSAQETIFVVSILLTIIVLGGIHQSANTKAELSPNLAKQSTKRNSIGADLIAFSSILVSWIFSYPGFDDGWFRSIQSAQRTTGEFVSYFGGYPELRDVPYPLGTFWNYVMQNFSSAFITTLATTFINVVLWTFAWLLISRYVVLPWKDQVSFRLVSAIVFSLFVLDSGMSLRPEPFLTLLLIGIMAIPQMPLKSNELKIALIALCSLLAIFTYPTGIGVFLAGGISTIYLAKTCELNHKLFFAGLAAATGISIQLLMINSNIFETFNLFKIFANGDASHSGTPYTEYLRIQNVFSMWGGQTQILLILTYVSLLIVSIGLVANLGFESKQRSKNPLFLLQLQALAVFVGLLATPSKWGWHLLVVMPAVVVAMLLVDRILPLRQKVQIRVLFAVSFFITGSGLIYLKGGYGAEDLRHGNLVHKYLLLNPNSNELFSSLFSWWAWVIVGVIVFEILCKVGSSPTGNLSKTSVFSAVSIALIPLFLVPGIQLVAPATLNLMDSGWNFNKQQIFGISDEKLRCGIPSNTKIVTSAAPLVPVNYYLESRSSRSAESKFSDLVSAQVTHSPLGRQNIFWLENNYVQKRGVQIFDKPAGVDEVGFWITSDESNSRIVDAKSSNSNFLLEFIDSNGRVESKRFAPGTADYWHLVTMKTEKISGEIRVTVDPSRDFRFVALSTVASISRGNAIDVLEATNATLLLDPTTVLFSPCTKSPPMVDGIWKMPEYSLGTRSRDIPPFDANSPKYQIEAAFVEVGCPRKLNTQARTQMCIFKLSK